MIVSTKGSAACSLLTVRQKVKLYKDTITCLCVQKLYGCMLLLGTAHSFFSNSMIYFAHTTHV